MVGISLLIELLRNKPALSNPSIFHSSNFFSSVVAASAAAASVAASQPLASRFLFSHIAYCDAGAAVWGDDYISNLHKGSESIFYDEAISYRVKEYPIELKPLFSAFGLKTLTMTTIRALLMFYLPLLEPHSHLEEEEEEDFPSDVEDERVDLITPLKKSVKQIFRESAVVTTRRVLERIAVHYISQRMAWKLLKATCAHFGQCPCVHCAHDGSHLSMELELVGGEHQGDGIMGKRECFGNVKVTVI